MPLTQDAIHHFLSAIHPYDAVAPDVLDTVSGQFVVKTYATGDAIYPRGVELDGLYLIYEGEVEVCDDNDVPVSLLGPRNSFGERGLMRDGISVTSAKAQADTTLLLLPASAFHEFIQDDAAKRFFNRGRVPKAAKADLATTRVSELMAVHPLTCAPDTSVQNAAAMMADAHVSSLCITDDGTLKGIATTRDLSGKVVARALPYTTHISHVMTKDPLTLHPSAIGSDVLHMMMERRIGHVPITEAGKLVGIVTQTDLTRFQAVSSATLVSEIADATSAKEMAKVTERIPQLLVQLVAAGNRHEVVTRLITDIADTATRRLLSLAEEKLGPPPVPYLWLACGSQGRQEQTGVSDQDNCLFLDDAVTDEQRDGYFAELAKFVCDGLNTCGYVYCPGDMMATNPRWCQPLSTWRSYFDNWIHKPSPEAQMLASVMFDLRPIGGTQRLFDDLQETTLETASKNSIFVAHMVSNSLKHTPPLGLLRGFATIRSGEHKNQIDLKHNGVVPVVDLGRIYSLQGRLTVANTRARLKAAIAAKVLSESGGQELLDAYDLIAETRLDHQAAKVKADQAPDNFLNPSDLSDFDRSHLRDAFVVIKSMQSAVGHGRGMLG